jgi:uncharacterized protein (DUF1330 family)
MPAYVILINNKTTDATELDLYRPKAVTARAAHPMTLVAINGKFEVLEGASAESVSIAQFPDMAAAKAWYDSPEYRCQTESAKERGLPHHSDRGPLRTLAWSGPPRSAWAGPARSMAAPPLQY